MTRTVAMAKLWPMPGDEWSNRHIGLTQVCVVGTILITITDGDETVINVTLDAFRDITATATPVRIFEGEA